jgi:hypothetical protein
MAYNNGPGQIQDAIRETGSTDPSELIREYRGAGFGEVSKKYYAMFLAASSLALRANTLFPALRKQPPMAFKTLKLEHEWTPQQLRILSGYSSEVIRRYNPALKPIVFDKNLPMPKGFPLRLPAGLPSSQDLQFADLRIAGSGGEDSFSDYIAENSGPERRSLPALLGHSLQRLRSSLFPSPRREDQSVLAFMHRQGLLDAERLALAKKDNILIEPHPALAMVIRNIGG